MIQGKHQKPESVQWPEGGEPSARDCLVWADDPAEIAALEAEAGQPQAALVSWYIEDTCWGSDAPDLRALRGGRGTPQARLAALRVEMLREEFGPFYRTKRSAG